jgi:lambda family phage portal protein
MGFIDRIFKIGKKEQPEALESRTYPNDANLTPTYGMSWPIITKKWDGEKTPGELGVVVQNLPDYKRLRLRAYDAEMRIDIINILTSRYANWVVGSGLKLQSEPIKNVLESENVKMDFAGFPKKVESRFQIFSESKNASSSGELTLHDLAMSAFTTSFVGGDALVICRIQNKRLNVQIVDGQHIDTPGTEQQDLLDKAKDLGHTIQNGIELNKKGKAVAFYVKIQSDDFECKYDRVNAYGEKTGRNLAWMVYGSKHRIDHTRGITRLSHVLEKVNKLDRYNEATVSKAEQGANIVFSIEHDNNSMGEDIMKENFKKKLKITGEAEDPYALSDGLANTITQTTSNQTFNMPIGAKLKPYQSEVGSEYEQFQDAVFSSISASMNMPAEFALFKFNSNYSASRAAINGWGYIVDIERKKFSKDFYKRIYKLWLELEILSGKIQAPGFIEALKSDDYMVVDAYSNARFVGKNMPHIDPLKEVKAVRSMLGDETTPLISREQATENLNAGSWSDNYSTNLKESEDIKPVEDLKPTEDDIK